MTVYTTKSVLDFGKHKGKTIDDVLDIEPEWLLWAEETVDFFEMDKNAARLARQAAED